MRGKLGVPSAYPGNRVSQDGGKGWGKAQSDGVTTLRNSDFWNLVEEVGQIKLPHCHGSTISPLASNLWSLSNDWEF